MRRVLCAALLVAGSLGILALPAVAAANSGGQNQTTLSFDFSDNNLPPAVSNGDFKIIVDVVSDQVGGLVRVVAESPSSSGVPDVVCKYQDVAKYEEAECSFDFAASGIWKIRAEYAADRTATVSAVSVTKIIVGD